MFEKEKIQEAYMVSVVNESADIQVKKAIEKVFSVKVKKIDVKKKFIIHLSDFIDNEDFDNFGKIDAIDNFIKKKYKDSIIEWKGRTIEIEEL
jgi:hypothetical protein